MVSVWRGRDRKVACFIAIGGELPCLAAALFAGKNHNLFRGPALDRLAVGVESPYEQSPHSSRVGNRGSSGPTPAATANTPSLRGSDGHAGSPEPASEQVAIRFAVPRGSRRGESHTALGTARPLCFPPFSTRGHPERSRIYPGGSDAIPEAGSVAGVCGVTGQTWSR
jgi:hypothetical protein